MGFDRERFGEQIIDDELICKICQLVLEEPKKVEECEHTFCGNCINIWLNDKATCPTCAASFQREQLRPPPKLLFTLLSRLQIFCEYKAYGCEDVLSLAAIAEHQTQCPFHPEKEVTCENVCGLNIRRREFAAHDCVTELKTRVQSQVQNLGEKENKICQLTKEVQLKDQTISQLNSANGNQKTEIENLETRVREFQAKEEATVARKQELAAIANDIREATKRFDAISNSIGTVASQEQSNS